MISGRTKIDWYAQINLILNVKFGDDPMNSKVKEKQLSETTIWKSVFFNYEIVKSKHD